MSSSTKRGYTYIVLNAQPPSRLHQTANHPDRPWLARSDNASIRWYRDSRNRLYARIMQVSRLYPNGEANWYRVKLSKG